MIVRLPERRLAGSRLERKAIKLPQRVAVQRKAVELLQREPWVAAKLIVQRQAEGPKRPPFVSKPKKLVA